MIIFRCFGDVTTWLVICVLLRTATESSELRGRNYDGSHCAGKKNDCGSHMIVPRD